MSYITLCNSKKDNRSVPRIEKEHLFSTRNTQIYIHLFFYVETNGIYVHVQDKTQIIKPFLNSRNSANHDKVEGLLTKDKILIKGIDKWYYIVKSLLDLLYLPIEKKATQKHSK